MLKLGFKINSSESEEQPMRRKDNQASSKESKHNFKAIIANGIKIVAVFVGVTVFLVYPAKLMDTNAYFHASESTEKTFTITGTSAPAFDPLKTNLDGLLNKGVNPSGSDPGDQGQGDGLGGGDQGQGGDPGSGDQGQGDDLGNGGQGQGDDPGNGDQGQGGDLGNDDQGQGDDPGSGDQGQGDDPGSGDQGQGDDPGSGDQGQGDDLGDDDQGQGDELVPGQDDTSEQ